jgi:Cu/Ag efflux protein CusF
MMWIMTTRFTMLLPALAIALAIALTGCGAAKDQPKHYAVQGEIKALDPATRMATIAHEKIGDWMGAMTMDYAVKPDAEFQKLHVGDKIQATMVVESDVKYYVTDVKVTPK